MTIIEMFLIRFNTLYEINSVNKSYDIAIFFPITFETELRSIEIMINSNLN